jgi:tellurite resistance protein
MTTMGGTLVLVGLLPASESYSDLLRSGPHWLFELTIELVSAPLAFAVGWLWRNGLLRHLHRDLQALGHGAPRVCVEPTSGRRVVHLPGTRLPREVPATSLPEGSAPRLPVSWFSMPFGLAGLGMAWALAAHHGQAPAFVGAAVMAASFCLWLVLLSVYAGQAARRWRNVVEDLEDPTAGPFTALALLTPLLLTVGTLTGRPDVARPVFDGLTVLMVVLAGWLTGQWIYGPLSFDRLHPGYFLPSVAGGYAASGGAAALGQPRLAELMFGIGSLSWLVLGALVIGRLMFRPALPAALVPTLAIEVAPPALASLAWFSMNGGRLDPVAAGLLGYGLLMLIAQLRLLPAYLRLTFTAGSWAFTFPAAAVATAALQWLSVTDPTGEGVWSALVLALVTLLVLFIGAGTVRALLRGELLPRAAWPPHLDTGRRGRKSETRDASASSGPDGAGASRAASDGPRSNRADTLQARRGRRPGRRVAGHGRCGGPAVSPQRHHRGPVPPRPLLSPGDHRSQRRHPQPDVRRHGRAPGGARGVPGLVVGAGPGRRVHGRH